MKYMLLITQGEWFANATEGERKRSMDQVVDWWGKQFASGKMVGGHQLQPPDTATTVVIERGKYVMLDCRQGQGQDPRALRRRMIPISMGLGHGPEPVVEFIFRSERRQGRRF